MEGTGSTGVFLSVDACIPEETEGVVQVAWHKHRANNNCE